MRRLHLAVSRSPGALPLQGFPDGLRISPGGELSALLGKCLLNPGIFLLFYEGAIVEVTLCELIAKAVVRLSTTTQ